MAASVIPIAGAFVMIFAPPTALSDIGLVIWMPIAIIGWYPMMTAFFVPHLSVGGELSTNYHERSRLFGAAGAHVHTGGVRGVGGGLWRHDRAVGAGGCDRLYDEHRTGERKKGSYFAAWNFVYKNAFGIMLALTGFVLDLSGFVPNQPQTMTTQVWMVGLNGAFPLICYSIGAALFSRFKLDEAAYREIRKELDSACCIGLVSRRRSHEPT